ncbi:hypothetical protein ACFFJB_07705 [Camelimonas abortus]|uniref:Uncharacterized protein n=1 Tax=Camelimonas abortus TaxID=1017184 RepID=A0ABV7LF94_9HYPH
MTQLPAAALAGAAIGLAMAALQVVLVQSFAARAIERETEGEGPSPDEGEFRKRLALTRRLVWSSLAVLPLAGALLGALVSRI